MSSHRTIAGALALIAPLTLAGPARSAAETIRFAPSDVEATNLIGCVYDAVTGRTVEGPFVIRVLTRSGIGLAGKRSGGCFDGIGITDVSPDAWDFIEVLYEQDGRFYSQQRRLAPGGSAFGFDFLGLPANTARYDFHLDIVHPRGPRVDPRDH
jgi:hypothetical protein